MAQTTLNVRIDEDVKKGLEDFCFAVGMNVSVAVNMFAKTVVREQRLPFEIAVNRPNIETLEAIAEVQEMEKNSSIGRSYTDVDEMMRELLS
jgi:DNA-damage-inducible protein J